MHCHEVDRFRRRLFCRHHQVAFVLAIGVVGHDDELPRRDVAHDIVDGIEFQSDRRLRNHKGNTITAPFLFSNGNSLRAGRDNRFRPVEIVVAPLEFRFQFHFEMREVHQVPAGKLPAALALRLVFETDDEVDCVVSHFVRRHLRFEIERAKTALTTSRRIKFWVEIEDTLTRPVDNAQIGITRALDMPFRRAREIATQSGGRIEQLAQEVLDMTAQLIDPGHIVGRTFRRVHPLHCLIEHNADLLDHALIDF